MVTWRLSRGSAGLSMECRGEVPGRSDTPDDGGGFARVLLLLHTHEPS